jgi:hypothetical protein
MDIFLQTDTLAVQLAFRDHFGARVRIYEGLPAVDGSVGIHMMDVKQAFGLSPQDLGIRMMASVLLMSRCHHVVTTSGNVGAWIAFYRGNTQRLYQFDGDGRLVEPDDALVAGDLGLGW